MSVNRADTLSGFTIPISYMQGWARWINYINPTAYGFESLMINEFSGQNYDCAIFVPPAPFYGDGSTSRQACNTVGSVSGQTFVSGEAYIVRCDSFQIQTKTNKRITNTLLDRSLRTGTSSAISGGTWAYSSVSCSSSS